MKIKLASIAALMLAAGVASSAMAATTTTVTFKAQLQKGTCDIATSSGSIVDFGVFTTESVTQGPTTAIANKDFNLVLTNCAGAETQSGALSLYADGQASIFNPNLFANTDAKTLAVGIKTNPATGTAVEIKPNQLINVNQSLVMSTDDEGAVTDVDGNAVNLLPMQADLFALNGSNDTDILSVPVIFSVAYN
ncbi:MULTISPECIES: fimbrial protein [Providencia]|uniref:Fimbrial protein n=2 Tax=Providencia TaxID=586 RepID=A0ABX7ADT6_9GAMM|nr:fimbrial protein [Providencia manganoxydans]MDX4945807.1 fimbrial protein [Providencia manganoxydans]QQO61956.1 fimbrial protein [Providencia manganoxydans]HEF8772842.1 fimbrial protein [Providencia stuartii]